MGGGGTRCSLSRSDDTWRPAWRDAGRAASACAVETDYRNRCASTGTDDRALPAGRLGTNRHSGHSDRHSAWLILLSRRLGWSRRMACRCITRSRRGYYSCTPRLAFEITPGLLRARGGRRRRNPCLLDSRKTTDRACACVRTVGLAFAPMLANQTVVGDP